MRACRRLNKEQNLKYAMSILVLLIMSHAASIQTGQEVEIILRSIE